MGLSGVKMPITAKTQNADMVIAADLHESDRARGYYYCRFCGTEMKLVLPKKNIVKHFRHVDKCDCAHSGESMAHLEAKMYFYNLYKDDPLYSKVSMEEIVGDRIGDIVLHHARANKRGIVIEIQNSVISTDEIGDRFDDWNGYGYDMLWVVTERVITIDDDGYVARKPKWTKKLHQIFMGRVYQYIGGVVYAIHFHPVHARSDGKALDRHGDILMPCKVVVKDMQLLHYTTSPWRGEPSRQTVRAHDAAWWLGYKRY